MPDLTLELTFSLDVCSCFTVSHICLHPPAHGMTNQIYSKEQPRQKRLLSNKDKKERLTAAAGDTDQFLRGCCPHFFTTRVFAALRLAGSQSCLRCKITIWEYWLFGNMASGWSAGLTSSKRNPNSATKERFLEKVGPQETTSDRFVGLRQVCKITCMEKNCPPSHFLFVLLQAHVGLFWFWRFVSPCILG